MQGYSGILIILRDQNVPRGMWKQPMGKTWSTLPN